MLPGGYSGTPLIKKLGIKPEMKIMLIKAPHDYMELLGADVSDQHVLKNETPHLVHLFAEDNASFLSEMKTILKICRKNSAAIVWVSWYKKSSPKATDLSEDMIRAFALQNDLVDVKVCAVSADWSGLKLVVPVVKR